MSNVVPIHPEKIVQAEAERRAAIKPTESTIRRIRSDVVACHWHCHELTPPLVTMDEIKKHVAQFDGGSISAFAALMAIAQAMCLSSSMSEPVCRAEDYRP